MRNEKYIRAVRIFLAAGAILAAAAALPAQSADENRRFQDAKQLVFDEKWVEAQARLEDFLDRFPRSALAPQAHFYRAKCLGERDGRESEAIAAFKKYLRLEDPNPSLSEDAEVSIIDLAMKLYDGGDKGFLREVESRIDNLAKAVRYYAAIQLSYVKEKRIADRSVPVLKRIIEDEASGELRDRARIALLRVSPESLAGIEGRRDEKRVRMLRVEVLDPGTKKAVFKLTIPWALADLALSAIPDDQKAAIRAKGYDVNRILRDLDAARGTVFEVNDPKSGTVLRIWIESRAGGRPYEGVYHEENRRRDADRGPRGRPRPSRGRGRAEG